MKCFVTLLCVIALAASGCTTTRVLNPNLAAPASEQLDAGDSVHVYLKDGRDLQLTVVSWNGEQLVGTDESQQSQSIARGDIARLELATIDGPKTMLAVTAIAGVALIAYLLSHIDEAAAAALCC